MKTFFFFFFRDHHDFRTKLVFRLRISDNFFVISEMYSKIMIWANVTKFGQNFIAPKIFWAGTAMSSTATLIDHFYTNYTHSCSNCYIIKSDLTDHFLLTVKIHQKLTKKQNPIKFVCSLKSFDKDKFCDDLEEACIQNMNSSQSINDPINILLHVIHTAMNQLPLCKLSRKQTKLQEKPWLTSGLLKSIKNQNKMFSALCKLKF